MGLFDRIFRPKEAKKSDDVVQNGTIIFKELNSYRPVFTDHNGEIYESELVRSAMMQGQGIYQN